MTNPTSSIQVSEEGAEQRPLTYAEAIHCYQCGATEVASAECNCQTFRFPRNALQAILSAQSLPQGDEVERRAREMFDEVEVRRLSNPHTMPARWEDHRDGYLRKARQEAALARSKLPIDPLAKDEERHG